MELGSFKGTVKQILFRNSKNYYSVFLSKIEDKTETVVGFFPILNEELVITFHGKKEKGRKGKEQYNATSYSFELPNNNSQLYRFLTNDFLELDLLLTMKIIDDIGVDFLTKYNDNNYLKKKLTPQIFSQYKLKLIDAKLKLNQIKQKIELMETMITMGFAADISAKVAFSEFNATAQSIKENPYQLIFPFDLSWSVVDFIALKNGITKKSQLRIHEATCYLLDDASKQAHIYLPKQELHLKVNRLTRLNINSVDFKNHLQELRAQERVFCDIEDHIYGYRYYRAEQQLSRDLYRVHEGVPEDTELVERIIDEVLEDGFPYSDEQINAIKCALINPLTIINGPAGSGKTTILRKISQCLRRLFILKSTDKKIEEEESIPSQLCAPTGKASERMKEVTGEDSSTIHSILSHNPLTKLPRFNSDNPLPFDCLIIDEAGMIDTVLFSHILNAAKNGAKIIILGDVHQLPSIGPGNVLHELLNWDDFNIIQLTKVHRTGKDSRILELATKTRTGDSDVYQILSEKNDELTFVENSNVEAIANQIVKSMEILRSKKEFDFYNDVQVVSPIHKSEIGVKRLNERIQELLNQKGDRKKLSIGNKDFYELDKVIQNVNNKEKKVFNGETGKIIEIINSSTLVVKFTSGKLITYSGEELFEIDLAFAVSVHKMQGSEAAVIIFPVHIIFDYMLQRKLFYTAITRAKRKLLLLGQREAVRRAIMNDMSEKRNCNLKRRLTESRLLYLVS